MNRQLPRRWVLPLIFLMAVLAYVETAAAESRPLRLLILPFRVNSQTDLNFLKDGIFDMLASRLAFKDEVIVLGRNETESALKLMNQRLDQSAAAQAGKRLNADYVLLGSMTEFGESLSMDATLIDMSGTKPPMTFFGQSPNMDEVIPAVIRLAAQINRKAFGRETYVEEAYEEEKPAPFDIHTNPEKLMERGLID